MQMIALGRCFNFFVLVCYACISVPLASTSVGWQSIAVLSNTGARFSPTDEQALLLLETTTSSWRTCSDKCHSTAQCRIFDHDQSSLRCRLFEGDMQTMGSVVSSSSPESVVGSIQLRAEFFADRGQPCSSCAGSRYLRCMNGSCVCEANTFFDGSICRSQGILGDKCTIAAGCRKDLNFTCLPRQQCAPSSIQTATLVGGYGNGTSDNGLNALYYPVGLALGVDNSLYVADKYNHRVIRLTEGSRIGSRVAGTGVVGNTDDRLNEPMIVHVDAASNIYIADTLNYRIMVWRANATAGIRVAGNGSLGNTLSTFGIVSGIFVDSTQNMYVCDRTNNRVMKFSPNVTNAVIVAGNGTAGSGSSQLNMPYAMFVDEGNSYLYVADTSNHRIQRFQLGVSTVGVTVAGGNGPGPANYRLNTPSAVCVSQLTGAMYIADSNNDRVVRWSAGASSGVVIAGAGALITNSSTSVAGPTFIRLSNNESHLFVSQVTYNTVWRFKLV